jgi:3-methyladenine DNA glycosylase/8-oxoguanine DNA glycosylase
MKLTLAARPPFSLFAVVRSHGWASLAPFSWDEGAGELAYIAPLSTRRVVEMLIHETSTGVAVDVAGSLDANEREEVERMVEWMLGLDQDLAPFHALARAEPKLARVVERAQGRILRSPTLFEDVVKTILTTNTTWTGTIRMVAALVAAYGAPLPADPTRRAFPTAERLAAVDEEALRSAARLGYRTPYVLDLARSLARGSFDLEALKAGDNPTHELRKRLLAIKGVGEYAAANLLMMLGHYAFVPVDSWALKIVSHEWYEDRPIGRAEVEAAFERWGDWKGLAYWFWNWAYTSGAS